MEQRQQPLERRERRRRRVLVALAQPRLDRLGVPVAEVVEGEAVERLDRVREVERRPRLLELGARRVEPRQDPALLDLARPRLRLDPVLEQQPRDVPELVRELPALLERALGEADVLRRGHLQQAVARRVGAVLRDQLERVDAVAEALRHPPAVRGQDRRVDDHVGERDLTQQLEPRPDHPVLPEADDLAGGRVDVAGVVALELGRPLRPAEGRVGPERGREPGVEHVRVALELAGAALGARVRRRPGAGDVAVRAVPERLLVPPPELARDVPVRDLLERADRELVLRLGVVADAPLLQRRERRLARLLHRHPPLQRDERLDPGVAALARADRVPVVLALLEPVVLLQPGEHGLVGLLLRLPGEVAGVLVHPAVRTDHGQDLELVVAADLEVGRVVAGRDLERAGAELGLDARVGDHRHGPLDVGDEHLLADRVAVALVVGMDGDGDVGEDRRRPHGRDRDVPGAVRERVAGIRERVVHVDVLDLEVRDRRLVERAPVDDPLGAVDPAAVPEVDEEAHHRFDVGVVHREALAAVVERGAERCGTGP